MSIQGQHVGGRRRAADLELSAKYFFTRQEGDTIALPTGERMKFDSVYSSRNQIGERLSYDANGYVPPFFGAYWEREFDGRGGLKPTGSPWRSLPLRGDTGIGVLWLPWGPRSLAPCSST